MILNRPFPSRSRARHSLWYTIWTLVLVLNISIHAAVPDQLRENFAHPPDTARPWVYWFWNNGNITKAGIMADLEAMQRVGIGGVLIMDVVERFAPPEGTATFMSPEWMDLFHFAVQEASRRGIEINMTNAPGWCGSSDPSITPEMSMQELVTTGTEVSGPAHLDMVLAKPALKARHRDALASTLKVPDFYRDVVVLAYPSRLDGAVTRDEVLNLSGTMGADGRLAWDAPPGKWTIERIGTVSTLSSTRPPVLGGVGLECDKLSAAAMDLHFASVMKKLIDVAGPLAGKTLVATHIDSWEIGSQNWTPLMREEFQKRRGYDPLPLLPDVTDHLQIGGKAIADRFRWDYSQTLSELLAQNYTGHIAELAHRNGLRFTLEGYSLPFGDEATYTAPADEPMTEFWRLGKFAEKFTLLKARQMASVAHIYGKPIVGAEAFTSDDNELWEQHPATIKALGDYEFACGVNRFVFHRYAFQPYLDKAPGATMGPWGLHYERTNTWWDWTLPWHQYLARCQYMLRQGLYVADVLYLRPEVPNQTYFTATPPAPIGYHYDEASAQAIIERANVADGRIVLPDGMSYRLLVLPPLGKTMTPPLLHKLQALVTAGAVICGPPPTSSPSLTDYPHCDEEVAALSKEMWGDCDGKAVKEHPYGKGRVIWGEALSDILAGMQTPPDFTSDTTINWIHRHTQDAEIYFVANPAPTDVNAKCSFRAPGLQPELWNPENGIAYQQAVSESANSSQTLPIHLDPSGSAFIIFRHAADSPNVLATSMGETVLSGSLAGPWKIEFSPGLGAPVHAEFPTLISWSNSPEPGIRYFSGAASYSKSFAAKPAWLKPGARIALDLGDVQIMAHVVLNGHDLGILWKPPYRTEITGLLKPDDNDLEVKVVNLWPNRLIGDAALPESQRHTWSSWEPFTKETPLLPSGLLGPVTVQSQAVVLP